MRYPKLSIIVLMVVFLLAAPSPAARADEGTIHKEWEERLEERRAKRLASKKKKRALMASKELRKEEKDLSKMEKELKKKRSKFEKKYSKEDADIREEEAELAKELAEADKEYREKREEIYADRLKLKKEEEKLEKRKNGEAAALLGRRKILNDKKASLASRRLEEDAILRREKAELYEIKMEIEEAWAVKKSITLKKRPQAAEEVDLEALRKKLGIETEDYTIEEEEVAEAEAEAVETVEKTLVEKGKREKARMLMKEADGLYKSGDYEGSAEKYKEAKRYLE